LRRRTLTVALAGILALLGAVAVLAYVRQANIRAVDGLKAETVLAATSAIRAGTSLATAQSENLLKSEKVPVASLSTEPVHSVTAANAHLVISSNVAPGQLLLQNMLASSATVAASPTIPIPQGKVAVTVQMCAAEAVANYLTAGSHVSVYASFPTTPKVNVTRTCDASHVGVPPGGASTTLVLPDVLVLSVTHALPSSLSTSSGSSSAVADPVGSALSLNAVAVTFAVTPDQAGKLIEVAQLELPYLALLPAG
jgi:pilus assembly protein CpaB